jgi:hypothetical protein
MKKTFVLFVVSVVLLLSGVGVSQAIMIGFDPSDQTVNLGDSVNVDVNISGLASFSAPSLGGFDIDFTYDPSILSLGPVTFGSELDLLLLGSIQLDTAGFGTLNIFELSLDPAVILDTLQPDSFTLASLTFDTLALGSSSINIAAINGLSDAFGNPLVATTQSGNVDVVPEPGTIMLLGSGLAGLGYFRRKIS